MSDDSQNDGGGQRISAPVYEMLWNCEYCSATKLLGKTHRHCPQCGAAQDPSARYFPPDEEKIAVQDHVYFGVDWKCINCQTPNSSASAFCGNCGAPKDGSGKVELAHDKPEEESADTAPPPEPDQGGGKGKAVGCCVLFFIIGLVLFCGLSTFWTKSSTLTVSGHTWERTIQIEAYGPTSKSDWCDKMPSDAYDVRKSDKQRDVEKIPDGEDCTTKNVDNGDGTFRQEEECTTRYRDKPIYDDWCSYTIDQWSQSRVASAAGSDLSPSWPSSDVNTCNKARVGCEREGQRGETYTVTFRGDGETHSCELSESEWRSLSDGDTVEGEVSMVTGGLQCGSLK